MSFPGIDDFAEGLDRAVGVGDRTLAAELVQAPALPVPRVAKSFSILPGIKMSTPLAIVMNPLAIGKQWTIESIGRRERTEGQEMNDGCTD